MNAITIRDGVREEEHLSLCARMLSQVDVEVDVSDSPSILITRVLEKCHSRRHEAVRPRRAVLVSAQSRQRLRYARTRKIPVTGGQRDEAHVLDRVRDAVGDAPALQKKS